MPSTPIRRRPRLHLIPTDPSPPSPETTVDQADVREGGYAYPHLEDIVVRALLARPGAQMLDTVCDVIVALELEGVVEVCGRDVTRPDPARRGSVLDLSTTPSTESR